MSSKCWSRKRRPARRPARCSISKKSKSVLSRLCRRQLLADEVEIDAVHVDAAVFARPGAVLQRALVDQPAHELDGAVFGDQRGVERDLVDAVDDLLRCLRRRRPQHRIDLHHQHVLGVGGAEERKDRRVGGVAAVPVGHAVDLDRLEHVRQRRRGHHRVGVDLVAREDAQPAGVHVGRRDEQRHLALLHRVEIDEAHDQVLAAD